MLLLWLEVEYAALSLLHLVHGSVHSQRHSFVLRLTHHEAHVPGVEQPAAAGPFQVHCDAIESERYEPKASANPDFVSILRGSQPALTVDPRSVVGVEEAVAFDLDSPHDSTVVHQSLPFELQQFHLLKCLNSMSSHNVI